jgi:hypothetical protein
MWADHAFLSSSFVCLFVIMVEWITWGERVQGMHQRQCLAFSVLFEGKHGPWCISPGPASAHFFNKKGEFLLSTCTMRCH